MLRLKLYVTGMTPRSRDLIQELETLLNKQGQPFELQVLDIFEHPDEAYDDLIEVTPTLIRNLPPPITRIIGDLSDRERILAGLELSPLS